MNDDSRLDKQQLNTDALLNTLMYLGGYYDGVPNGTSVQAIVNQIKHNMEAEMQAYAKGHTEEEVQKQFGDDYRKVTALTNALGKDSRFDSLVIANQTVNMADPRTGLPYENGGLYACTFQDSLSNPTYVTVVYRGTGGGEWYDNGLGLSGQTVGTDQQIQAAEYFDYIVGRNGWNVSEPEIHVTGHSKGGNKTQYVVMMSEYSYLIGNAYSLDGQCMSQEAIDYMKEKYGMEEYALRRSKLYAISADNDYVNVLGVNNEDGRLIPADNIYYLDSNLSGVFWHYPDCYLNEDGTLTDFVDQGLASKMIESLSKATMDLPAPIRSIITNGAMAIAEMTLGNGKPVNGESFSYADVVAAVPLLLEMLPAGAVEFLGDAFGVDLDWLANTITACNLILFAPLNLSAYVLGTTIDIVIAIADKLKEIGKKCKEVTDKVVAFISNGVQKLQSWFNRSFNSGYRYAAANPQIRVDTFKLYAYAERLQSVNRRISALDRRMDSLYWKVGLRDLWTLMQADVLTGYSWRIVRCMSYLNDTARDFDNVESRLIGAL